MDRVLIKTSISERRKSPERTSPAWAVHGKWETLFADRNRAWLENGKNDCSFFRDSRFNIVSPL